MPTLRAVLLLAAAGACAGAASAQTIWRCGDTYSRQPCDDGRALGEATAAARDERSQAAAAAARDARLADAMEKDRLRQEAQASIQPAVIASPKAEPVAEKHKWPEQAGTRKLDVFTASAPGSRPAKARDKKKEKAKGAPAKSPGSGVGQPARP